jgi:myosin heavy subunit
MLIRISLILAIVAALAAGALNIFQVREKITTLISQRDEEHKYRGIAETDLASTKKELNKTKTDLTQTQEQLAESNAQRDKAVATATAQSKRADDLSNKLAAATQQRDDAQNQLAAYKTTGLTAEQVSKLAKTLKDSQDAILALNDEKTVLEHVRDRLKARLAKYEGPDTEIKLRADLKGKILVVDPKWDFVVLNVGEDQGVIQDGQLLVSRDGKLVAKVIVRSVDKNRCIANVIPGWKLGQVFEGDEVSPAYPAS